MLEEREHSYFGYPVDDPALWQVLRYLGRNDQAALTAFAEMTSRIAHCAASQQSDAIKAGFVAEHFLSGTHNAEAARLGLQGTFSKVGSVNGFALDPRVDIQVFEDGRLVDECQSKFARHFTRTAAYTARPQYKGTTRLVPSDQVEDVRAILRRAGNKRIQLPHRTDSGLAHLEAADRVTDRVRTSKCQGKSLRYSDAERMAQGDLSLLRQTAARMKYGAAVKNGALGGLLVGGVGQVIRHGVLVYRGDESVRSAGLAWAKDATGSAIRGTSISVGAQLASDIALTCAPRRFANAFVRCNAPLALATLGADLAVTAARGQLTMRRAVLASAAAGTTWVGAELGAIAFATVFPPAAPLGAVIGGLVGQMLWCRH